MKNIKLYSVVHLLGAWRDADAKSGREIKQ